MVIARPANARMIPSTITVAKVVRNVANSSRWTQRLIYLCAGLITMARIDARMNEVRNGQAICNKLGRSDATTTARKIRGPRFDIQDALLR